MCVDTLHKGDIDDIIVIIIIIIVIKFKLTESFLTTNQTLQFVIRKREHVC
jgi:hypothetical protein